MAGTITHKWNGTVLTITSDSGTSSADLKGATGDDGIRGPQGPAGIIIGDTGNISLEGYATKDYVDEAVANASTGSVDLSNYYNKTETDSQISTAISSIPAPDMTDYATKTYVDEAIADINVSSSGVGQTGTGAGAEIFNIYSGNDANVASGQYSHAEGQKTQATGGASHAEGINTTASGDFSHAEGWAAKATGESSHAEGYGTTAAGYYSHAEGVGTIANRANMHVIGRYNQTYGSGSTSRGDFVYIVGNGTSDTNRSNAYILDWDGNAWYAGEIECAGIILTSPNGTAYKITVTDGGALTTTAV